MRWVDGFLAKRHGLVLVELSSVRIDKLEDMEKEKTRVRFARVGAFSGLVNLN